MYEAWADKADGVHHASCSAGVCLFGTVHEKGYTTG